MSLKPVRASWNFIRDALKLLLMITFMSQCRGPDLPEGEEIREKLTQNLTADNLEKETAFFYSEGNKTFERAYGWAWLLKLALEMGSWDDPLGKEEPC